MLALLKRHFGFDAFRPLQEEIVRHVLSGRDALVVMPTGSGKSLCYQFPALTLNGLTLVVSPLIALMKDQVDALRANGIAAAFVNSTLPAQEVASILEKAKRGEWKLLYVAPERLALSSFRQILRELPVRLIAIDEAHCISEWGHDFRTDYRNLSLLRLILPGVPWIALTATANVRVREDIISQLKLENGRLFLSSFNRPNLTYLVRPKKGSFALIVKALESVKGSSAIIYCFSRKETEKVAEKLRLNGFNALPYHAGLEDKLRRRTQEKFIRDECPIIVATIAFGMGIDKPNVRLVIHADLPRSVEGYYQETGRAGRDGLPSTCLFLYTTADRWKREYFLRMIDDPEEQARSRQQMLQMMAYAETKRCRRKFLMEYFGESWKENECGGCDVCLGEKAGLSVITKDKEAPKDFDAVLFEQLRVLRRKLADERGVPAYVVFGDRSLQEMARKLPKSLDALDQINGVGKEKRKAFGATFVDAIRAYIVSIGGSLDEPAVEPERTIVSPVSDTLLETRALIQKKLSLSEIAERRGMVVSTILNHLEKLMSSESLDIAYLKPTDVRRFENIRNAFRESRGFALTPVRNRLGEEYSFDELRFARLFLREPD